MRQIKSGIVAGLCAIALGACSMIGGGTPAPTSGTIEENAVSVTARVQKIDYETRMVTVRTNDGQSVEFHAGPEVRNLAQVEPGDVIRVEYFESVVYEVRRPGEAAPGVRMAQDGATSAPGERPAAGAARAVVVTATVQAIDRRAPSVTLRGPGGDVTTLPVRDPRRLEAVNVGDLVEFTFTQAVAIAVEEVQQ